MLNQDQISAEKRPLRRHGTMVLWVVRFQHIGNRKFQDIGKGLCQHIGKTSRYNLVNQGTVV